jgi:ATP synthase protein I
MDPDETDDLAHRRERLYAELAKRTVSKPELARKTAGWGEATKIASEFVAGIAVGVVLGLIIDRVFGTSPFGLIACLMLGFAAGVLNVLRTQGVVPDAGAKLRGEVPKGARAVKDLGPDTTSRPDKNETTD